MFVIAAGTSCYVRARFSTRIYRASQVPNAPVAIVFGAGLAHSGRPSPMLAERLDAAVELYRIGKVEKVLLSGDNSLRSHDETRAMRRYAVDRGLPPDAVLRDYAGFSTYDSCYRAAAVFGVRRAILVTQGFHLPRALFIANSLGVDADGVAADDSRFGPLIYEWRELLSRPLALVMVVARPPPRFLGDKAPMGRE
jgi:SanA protein